MSGLTLQDLLEFEAAPWEEASQAWLRLAQSTNTAADGLVRSTRDLSDAWPHGIASEAAYEHVVKLRTETDNAHPPAKALSLAFSQHG